MWQGGDVHGKPQAMIEPPESGLFGSCLCLDSKHPMQLVAVTFSENSFSSAHKVHGARLV